MDLQKKKRVDFDEEEAVVAGDISVLGEDLFHDILLRLPPSSLLSSSSVSRYWLRVCSSPLFRLLYRSRRASSLLGFYVNYPCEGSFFIPSSPSSTTLSSLDSLQILDSRGGWLLLLDLDTLCLWLFHPIFNKTLFITQPSLADATSVFHALLPDPFSFKPLRRFRILRVSTKHSSCPIIEIFSSESPGEWKKIQSSNNIRTRHCLLDLHPVLVNGFVHWLKSDRQIISLDENNYNLSILRLPTVLPLHMTNHWLGKFSNKLCYVYVHESVLYVWVLVDRLHCEWHLEHRIEVCRFQEFSHSNAIRILAFGIEGSLNALFQDLRGNIISLDLPNGEFREIGKTDFDINHVFPYYSMEAD